MTIAKHHMFMLAVLLVVAPGSFGQTISGGFDMRLPIALLVLPALACSGPGKLDPGGEVPGKDAGVDSPTDDATPPDTAIAVKPAVIDNSTTVMFEFTSTERDSTFECSLDGAAFTTCQTPATYSNLGDGGHTFKVRATDKAGNPDPTPAEYSWTIDTSTPDTTITSGPPALSNSATAQFEFSSPDARIGATYECALDSGSFASCTSPRTYDSLADGTHMFHVRVRSAAGTLDPTPAFRSWTIDATPPDTMIVSGPANPTQLGIALFSFTSNDGTATYECSLDGAAFAACASPLRGWIDSGAHTMKIRASDAAGNVDPSPAMHSWTSDLANLVFVAHTNTSNLGGLTGADDRCAAAAASAGLHGTYRAWLSTTRVNAVDRLAGARGWIRTDGRPFVDTVASLLAGTIYYPPTIDANGVFSDAFPMTGSEANGEYSVPNGSCLDWTTADNTVTSAIGRSTSTSKWWTFSAKSPCGTPFRDFYCFGTDFTTPVRPPAPVGRIAFVTASKWLPGGGIAAADAVCTNEATAAGLSGTFKAALATSTASALARFSSTGARWVRVDGVPITTTTAALFDPNLEFLEAPVNVTAAGAYVSEPIFDFEEVAWVGPRSAGGTNNCADWTDASAAHNGAIAFNASTRITTEFTDAFGFACNEPHRLYCFQQ